VASEMATEYKCGQIMLVMKVSGKIIGPMDMVNLFMLMEIFTKAIG